MLTVNNLPAEALENLRFRAQHHARSMEAEARAILEENLSPSRHQLLAEIERETANNARTTTAEEVDGWILETRARPV